MDPTDTDVERGSGNVFVDLGFSDADAHLVKAELVSRIDGIVRQRSITQTEAARLLGLSQPDVSRLLRGDFREYSPERLFRLLNALGRDIDIVVRQPRSADGGRLRIAAAEPVVAGGVSGPACERLLLAAQSARRRLAGVAGRAVSAVRLLRAAGLRSAAPALDPSPGAREPPPGNPDRQAEQHGSRRDRERYRAGRARPVRAGGENARSLRRPQARPEEARNQHAGTRAPTARGNPEAQELQSTPIPVVGASLSPSGSGLADPRFAKPSWPQGRSCIPAPRPDHMISARRSAKGTLV